MSLKTIVLALGMFISVPVLSQQVSFFAEDLQFTLSDSCFEVGGWYYFRNNTSKEIRQMLFYPFPNLEEYGEVTFVEIHTKNDTSNLVATKSDKGSMFRLQIPANQEKAIWIRYRQKTRSNQAKYIITSTQAWDEPFEEAHYQLQFQANLSTLNSSIPPDSISESNGQVSYYWERKNFMPDRDFEFEFKTRQSH